MKTKYLIFRTESASTEGWRDRRLQPSNMGTSILAEHFDSSDSPLPKKGDRLTEFHHIPQFADSRFPLASTHFRKGDWQISRVEQYMPAIGDDSFEGIYICYCSFVPVVTPLEPLETIRTTEAVLQA